MNRRRNWLVAYAAVATLTAGFFAIRSLNKPLCIAAFGSYEPSAFQVSMDEKLERAVVYICQHQNVLNPGRPLNQECVRRLGQVTTP